MTPSTRPQLRLALLAITTTLWGPAEAQPSILGYETLVVHASACNLLALRFHQPAVTAGIGTTSATTLTNNNLDFDTALSSFQPYLVELTSGSRAGKVLDIVSFSGHTLSVAESLPTESNVLYRIRAIPRLSEVIDPLETLAVDDFNPDHGDLILIPSGGGKFEQYFYSSRIGHMGYFNATTGMPEDPLLRYTEAFFYLRRDVSPFYLVVSGEVKLTNTLLAVTDNFNYVGSAYPLIKLGDTHLEVSLRAGTADSADMVWLQDATGSYQRYFYANGPLPANVGWRLVGAAPGSENNDQGAVSTSSGMIIQRRAPLPYEVLLTPPAYYSNL